jgi:hypothetical protein
MPDSMVRLLKAVEHREHTATRHEVNWTKVQGGAAAFPPRNFA